MLLTVACNQQNLAAQDPRVSKVSWGLWINICFPLHTSGFVLVPLALLLPGQWPHTTPQPTGRGPQRSSRPTRNIDRRNFVVMTSSHHGGTKMVTPVAACSLWIVHRCRAGHSVALVTGSGSYERYPSESFVDVDFLSPSCCRIMARGDPQPNGRAPHKHSCSC